MKKLNQFVKRNFFSLLSVLALVVGTTASVSTTIILTHQVECPKELLK